MGECGGWCRRRGRQGTGVAGGGPAGGLDRLRALGKTPDDLYTTTPPDDRCANDRPLYALRRLGVIQCKDVQSVDLNPNSTDTALSSFAIATQETSHRSPSSIVRGAYVLGLIEAAAIHMALCVSFPYPTLICCHYFGRPIVMV